MQQPDSIAQELLKDREKGSVRFMAEYRERLYSVALALCHDETEAEDLVLRTLERIIEKIGDYQERDSFYNWACVIMLNLYRDSTRGKVVQGTVPVGGAAEMDALMNRIYMKYNQAASDVDYFENPFTFDDFLKESGLTEEELQVDENFTI